MNMTSDVSTASNAHSGVSPHDTHSKTIGYLLWIFGFTGSHRFYYGKPITGTIWFFTLGLLDRKASCRERVCT